jgi:hypothetical protein
MSATRLDNPKAISEAGTQIYNARYRAEYEASYRDYFVAINILDESAALGTTVEESLARAESRHPDGIFHVIWIGHPTAFQIRKDLKARAKEELRTEIAIGSKQADGGQLVDGPAVFASIRRKSSLRKRAHQRRSGRAR